MSALGADRAATTQKPAELSHLPYPLREFAYRYAIEHRKTSEWSIFFNVSGRTIRNWKHHPAVVKHVDQIKTIRITELQAMALQAERLALHKLCELMNQSILSGRTKDILKAATTVLGICGTIEQARADAERYIGPAG
jgi:hypothetical protein